MFSVARALKFQWGGGLRFALYQLLHYEVELSEIRMLLAEVKLDS